MPILNFKPQFVPAIREGRKNHTIRANRKIPVKPGDKLYLYCGLRHKGAFRILPDPVLCTKALPIRIRLMPPGTLVEIDGQELSPDEREALAVADGFSGWSEMAIFWTQTHGDRTFLLRPVDFRGQIIHWKPTKGGMPWSA